MMHPFLKLVVLLPTGQLRYIVAHARAAYPEECCGFLIGSTSTLRTVRSVLAARNVAQPSRLKRFSISPDELIRAGEEARRSNLGLIGIYHSHPDAPVDPSAVDLEYAWPDFTYIILSIERGEPQDVGAWFLNHGATAFELDELKLI
jgi:proteasome lid subunit RPN8/RPN11